ncbi:MAG: hypothetical protein R3F44_15600 [Candidatus Competibacteraceae bacterium]
MERHPFGATSSSRTRVTAAHHRPEKLQRFSAGRRVRSVRDDAQLAPVSIGKTEMEKLSVTKGIFKQLLNGDVPKNEIQLLAAAVDDNDVEWLMGEAESLTDPSAYFKGTAQGDENAVSGFFLYVDLISALIIHAGPSAREHAARHQFFDVPTCTISLRKAQPQGFLTVASSGDPYFVLLWRFALCHKKHSTPAVA